MSKNSNSEMLYDFAEQFKSNVLSKDKIALENRPSKTLEEIVPRMHLIFKQRYHYCFCGVTGKPDIIKDITIPLLEL